MQLTTVEKTKWKVFHATLKSRGDTSRKNLKSSVDILIGWISKINLKKPEFKIEKTKKELTIKDLRNIILKA